MPDLKQRPEQQKQEPEIQTSCKPRFWNAEDSNPRAKVTRVFGLNKGNLEQIGEFYYKDDAVYAMHASSNHQDLMESLDWTLAHCVNLRDLMKQNPGNFPSDMINTLSAKIEAHKKTLARAKGESNA